MGGGVCNNCCLKEKENGSVAFAAILFLPKMAGLDNHFSSSKDPRGYVAMLFHPKLAMLQSYSIWP